MRILPTIVLGVCFAAVTACGKEELTPEEFTALAKDHEQALSSEAAQIAYDRERDRVNALLEEAREEGGVVDLENGTAIVRHRLGVKHDTPEAATAALEEARDAWAGTRKVTITKSTVVTGHT
ncbi:MAG: hypothetical protein HY369_05095 [Candidatus Aenigmarchaeota archaeon]|nr:hypothetical protein [Candidatus Aenigmarchaeota archaeon]